ncbi:MAG: flavodoxin [Dehalococcoidia bacterium]|nr:MAG: flavodoxin [Dehalococcoidia bacterium]
MKILVAYMSQTGNTKKVAEAIYREIQADKEIKALKELDGLEGHDLYFVGFPMHAFGPAHAAKVFLENHAAGKDIVLFITHASHEDSELIQEWLGNCRAAAVGGNVIDTFHCQGELSEQVAEMLKKSDDPQMVAWAEQRSETLGQPDAARLERARVFARDTMKQYSG